MLCPSCDGKTSVQDSRAISSGDIRRRRICLECGLRLTTLEVVVRESEEGGPQGRSSDTSVLWQAQFEDYANYKNRRSIKALEQIKAILEEFKNAK